MSIFLEKIRNWPPEKKKKVMVWATVIVMVAVIIVWLVFFNNLAGKGGATGSIWQNALQKFKEVINSYKGK